MKRTRGITLLELLVTMVVIGVLASLAWPSYQSWMTKGRRSEAIGHLLSAQLKQEALRVTSGAYSTDFSQLGGDLTDHYTYSTSVSGSTYTLTAQPKSTSPQRFDTGCTSLTINQSDTKTPDTCWK